MRGIVILPLLLFGFTISFAYAQERTVTDTTSLHEIVVTGYGTQKRKELTSAITAYKGADPNPRYADARYPKDFINPLAPGIDRKNTWVRTRSVSLGITLGF